MAIIKICLKTNDGIKRIKWLGLGKKKDGLKNWIDRQIIMSKKELA
ncbi:MAG: hypothetical protein ISS38_03125 [Candidatus Cloacimonetes bacterium]|nr:hypothetical protein [Candidatus Cloacimonadota bacterium]